jgi:hypothetical protein
MVVSIALECSGKALVCGLDFGAADGNINFPGNPPPTSVGGEL